MLANKAENARRSERREAVWMTASSSVKRYVMLVLNRKQMIQNKSPIEVEVPISTLIENLTAPASPLPSSFPTRTLSEGGRETLFQSYHKEEIIGEERKD